MPFACTTRTLPKVDGNNIAQFDAVRRRVARPQGGGECPAKLQHQLAEVTEAELRRPKSERVGPINKIGTILLLPSRSHSLKMSVDVGPTANLTFWEPQNVSRRYKFLYPTHRAPQA